MLVCVRVCMCVHDCALLCLFIYKAFVGVCLCAFVQLREWLCMFAHCSRMLVFVCV